MRQLAIIGARDDPGNHPLAATAMGTLVQGLTRNGVWVKFVKNCLVFTGGGLPHRQPMLSVMGAITESERSLIRERQGEGIAWAKQRSATKAGKRPHPAPGSQNGPARRKRSSEICSSP